MTGISERRTANRATAFDVDLEQELLEEQEIFDDDGDESTPQEVVYGIEKSFVD